MLDYQLCEQLPGNIGWKDSNGFYLGCNQLFVRSLGLRNKNDIIMQSDLSLADYTVESYQFHHQNDQFALSGKTITAIHKSNVFHGGKFYFLVKKPLYDNSNIITGVIFQCHHFPFSMQLKKLAMIDAKLRNESSYYYINQHPNLQILTKRETYCLFYLLRGFKAKEIAARLGLSARTIEFYTDNIRAKFDCRNKAELIACAIQKGFLNYIPEEILYSDL